MTLLTEFLLALEQSSATQSRRDSVQWRGYSTQFLERRWLTHEGYLSTIDVKGHGCEDEAEVVLDEARGTFSYSSPSLRKRTITRALSEIAVYVANIDAWCEEVTEVFGIEPSRRARTRVVVADHLWHLGDLRVGRSHHFAPLYVGRKLDHLHREGPALSAALQDPVRPGRGLVLSAHRHALVLPNGHQLVEFDRLLMSGVQGHQCDGELLTRMLGGDLKGVEEYFDDRTGQLKLVCMDTPKQFVGIQKKVIKLLWNERLQPSLKWSDIVAATDCGRDPKSVFGVGWKQWIERAGYGRYRLIKRA
jgi:hypothetical protein